MSGKTWGPFTGSHLVAMFGFVVMAVTLPGTLWAVDAYSNVAIEDPLSGRKAAVDGAGRLLVGDISQIPSTFFHKATTISAPSGCVVIAAPPSGKALIVRQVRLAVSYNPTPGVSQDILVSSDTACGPFVADVNPPTIGHFVVPFDPGLGIRTGLSARVDGAIEAAIFVDGYLVPAGYVPATAATMTNVRMAPGRSPTMAR